jgi:hypothetical protein
VNNGNAHGVNVQALIHLRWTALHKGVVPLQSLFDGQQEDYVNENHAVCADQVKHLEGLGEPEISAFWLVVHPLDQCQHSREHYKTVDGPDPERCLARLDLE